jgi:hypothetical protein
MLMQPKAGLFIPASTMLRPASHILLLEGVAAEVGDQRAVDQPGVAAAAEYCRPQSTLRRDQLTTLLLALAVLAARVRLLLRRGVLLSLRGQTFRQSSHQVVGTADGGVQRQLVKTQWRGVLAGAQVALHLELVRGLLELTGRVIRAEIRRHSLLVAPLLVVAALALLVETQFLLA